MTENALFIKADVNIPISGTIEVSNFTPDGPANTLLVQYKDVGQWYKVENIGDTSSADWSALGALLGAETYPIIGRVFKAKTSSPSGSGTISKLIYNQNVVVSGGTIGIENFPIPFNIPVSLTAINATSQLISNGTYLIIKTMTISSNYASAATGDIVYLKFYATTTADETDTPILKVPLLTNQSVTITPEISFYELCVRATLLWADGDTTGPTSNISGSFFILGS